MFLGNWKQGQDCLQMAQISLRCPTQCICCNSLKSALELFIEEVPDMDTLAALESTENILIILSHLQVGFTPSPLETPASCFWVVSLASVIEGDSFFSNLNICETTSLSVNVLDLLGCLRIEVNKLLASWCTSSFFVVGGQSGQKRVRLLADTV